MNMKKRLVACLVIVALLCSSLLPAAAAEETDLLVNGGFETGDSTGWNWFNNAVVDSAAPHSGNYCAKVAKNSSYEQVVTVSPDTKYVLTGWAKSEGSSVMTLGVKNYGGQETFSATLSADYQQLAVTFTTGPNAQTATIYGYRQNSGSGAGYFDDVELTAVQDFTPYQPLANAIAPQAIPTYDGTNQPTHPSVVKFEQPWNGYLYWMAMTVVLFYLLFTYNRGEIRSFTIAGLLVGSVFYLKTISPVYISLICWILKPFFRLFSGILSLLSKFRKNSENNH